MPSQPTKNQLKLKQIVKSGGIDGIINAEDDNGGGDDSTNA